MVELQQTITWQVIADLFIGAAIPLGFLAAFFARRIGVRELLFLALGLVIGSTFEFAVFSLLGSVTFIMYWPLPAFTQPLWHLSWDGGLFMAGFYLAAILLRKAPGEVCARFDWRELAIMTVWGFATSFAVEFGGNGIIWRYALQDWNPVYLTVGDTSYTAFIHIVWLVVPSVFYLGCLGIERLLKSRAGA